MLRQVIHHLRDCFALCLPRGWESLPHFHGPYYYYMAIIEHSNQGIRKGVDPVQERGALE